MSNHNQAAADLHGDQKVRWRSSPEPIAHTRDLARKDGKSQRTHRRYLNSGPPVVRDFLAYGESHGDVLRVAAEVLTSRYQNQLKAKRTATLIRMYRTALADDKRAEAEDSCDSLDPGRGWMERAKSSKRDAGLDMAKAALEQEFERRGVPTDLLEVASDE